MNYDSTFYSPNQASSEFDFLMMQQSLNVKNKKIEKNLSVAKSNSNRFKNDKYEEFSSQISESSSPNNVKSEPIAMMNSQQTETDMIKSAAAMASNVVNSSFQANSSSASSTSSALSTCSLSSSPQQNNMIMLISNEPLYISSSLSEASSPPVSSVSSSSSNKHGTGVDDHYNQCQNGIDGYLDSSMSDDMDMNGNGCYGQVPCIGNEMDNGRNNMSLSSRTNRFFPDDVVDILNRWFSENQDYPYPDEHMTNVLAREANISAKQVRKWFANKRVRSNKCYKQNFKIKKEKQLTGSPKHSKSVSDCDGLIKDENRLYSDNEETDDCFDQDNMRSHGQGNGFMMLNRATDHHSQHLASDCELGMADISQATKSAKNKNKRFSYDFSSIPVSSAYNKYCSNPSSSSSSFTSSSPISHFDCASGSNNASANFGIANGSPLLASNNVASSSAYDLQDTHFSFVPNHGNSQRVQLNSQQQQQQQQHMFRSNSAHTTQELLYNLNMWKNAMNQNPSLALQNSLQAAHHQSQTFPSNLNLLQNIDNNVVANRLNSLAAAATAVNSLKNESNISSVNTANSKPTDASLICSNNNQINSSLPNNTATSPSLLSQQQQSQTQQQPQQQTTSSVTAIAAALCNQYYLMNLLQNPLAMQAALANRFLMLNQNNAAALNTSPSPVDPSKKAQDSSKNAKSTVNNNKRKSLLTKCFYNESASPVSHQFSTPTESTKQQQQLNRIKTPATQAPSQKSSEAPKHNSQLLVLASALSLQQQQQQDHQHHASAAADLQQSSTSPIDCAAIRRSKINFGVISDLIN